MTEEKFRERIEPQQAKPDGGPARDKSLRAYFAGQALVGYLANDQTGADEDMVAAWCYKQADAMIAARDAS